MDVTVPEELLEEVIVEAGEAARPWAEALVAEQIDGAGPESHRALAGSAAAALVGIQPAARLIQLATFYASAAAVRRLVENASPAERSRWIEGFLGIAEITKRDPQGAPWIVYNRLERALGVLDLCTSADVAEACTIAAKDKRWPDLAPAVERAGKGERRDLPRPTASARDAIAYLEAGYASARRAELLPGVARSAATRAVIVDDAGELFNRTRWLKAKPARRKAILRRVAAALGEDFTLDGATFTHLPSGVDFVAVPGGKLAMGFSDKEEALVRKAAKKHEGIENWFEEFGSLLEDTASMRPVHEVSVPPFLVAVAPLGDAALAALLAGGSRKRKASKKRTEPTVVDRARIVDFLEKSPFRLLSESEWEYAARAGRKKELTPFGNEVPDDEIFLAYDRKRPANDFGLTLLGLYPEVCSDSILTDHGRGYEGAPTDGTPRAGGSPCVARGGAAYVYPWQACGEWHLLCNAVRSSTGAWDAQASVRPAIGIRSAL
jgi:formylglycine-generating enzyme required for sulfatase activity